MEQLVTAAVERFGRVDTLINNAGVFIARPFTQYTAADYALITAVNLTGFFHITQRVIAQILAQGDAGNVVNVTTTLVEHANLLAAAPPVSEEADHRSRGAKRSRDEGTIVTRAGVAKVTALTLA